MAIKQEEFYIDNRKFIRTFSDEYRYIVRDGIEYTEAQDPAEFNRTYEEGNMIEASDTDYEMAGRIITGFDSGEYDMDTIEGFHAYEEEQQEFINIGKTFMEVENDNI